MSMLEQKKDILMQEIKRISEYKFLPDAFDGLDICVFGMGKIGRFAFQGLEWYFGERLKYVCDNDTSKFSDLQYKGLKVLTVDELSEKRNDCVVLIATSDRYSFEIAEQLKSKGIKNIRIFNGDPVSRFMDTCFAKYAYQKLPKVWEMLSDNTSKELLLERMSEIFYHTDLPVHSYKSTPQSFLPPELRVSEKPLEYFFEPLHYFPRDVVALRPDECFVDGGGYIGDTVDSLIKVSNGTFEKAYIFELEPGNYNVCQEHFKNDNRIEVFPYGISDTDKDVCITFHEENLSMHRISSDGALNAKAVAMDNILKDKKVTFIKMDVEGEEMLALKGGQKIIEQQRPILAISAYHKASDIFDVPLWITSICKDYKIYYRHHSPSLDDTVCYAIPKERAIL